MSNNNCQILTGIPLQHSSTPPPSRKPNHPLPHSTLDVAACAARPTCSKWTFRSSDGGCFVLSGDDHPLFTYPNPGSGFTAGISSSHAPPPSPPPPNPPPPNPPPPNPPPSPPPPPPIYCQVNPNGTFLTASLQWGAPPIGGRSGVATPQGCCAGRLTTVSCACL